MLTGSVWRARLVPLALALTAGIVYDHHAPLPLPASLLALLVSVCLGLAALASRQLQLALLYFCVGAAAAGAGYHALRRLDPGPDDVARHASTEPSPAVLRGVLASEPLLRRTDSDALRSFAAPVSTRFVLRVTHLRQRADWTPASGLVQVLVQGQATALHVGDQVEVAGRLALPAGPSNPGELDYAAILKEKGIGSLLSVDAPGNVTRLETGSPWSPARLLAEGRAAARATIEQQVSGKVGRLAVALLLGDGSALSPEEWEPYQRSGVIHVLVVSGQHMVLLAWFLWMVLRPAGVTPRRGALLVGLMVLAYALFTGGQAPALRGAAVIAAVCGALMLRRPVPAANSFALAWMAVALLDPTDVFDAGCQLSFLGVAVLYWGTGGWSGTADPLFRAVRALREKDLGPPLERLIEESRPAWQRKVRALGRWVAWAYAVNALVWLALAPLVAFHFHLVAPSTLLVGPPVVVLTMLALFAGFCLVPLALLAGPLGWPLARVMQLCLGWCDGLIDGALGLPGAYFYVPDLPAWWVWVYCIGLLAALTLEPLRRRWRLVLLAGLGWLALGLFVGLPRPRAEELRCTFLAVGHGGCTVLETADGRTLLYDAGSLSGPEVTRRVIAPYLWQRGIRRIDEVLISHADLDHFNGLKALLERFAVGHVTCTPTFARRRTPAVGVTLEALDRHGIPSRIVRAGDRLSAGAVTLEVLHPPAVGPDGNENARSLVLLVRHAGHSILLTGDLEGPGLARVLAQPAPAVDVLQAPHHGSRLTNTPELAKWARPAVVVSCQGPPKGTARVAERFEQVGARFLGTWPHGAVTVRSGANGLTIETFRTGKRWAVR
ncbi:MAG: ComEC/Rec2 family competence protein [Gemmataceae bacterium]|nr:ComEC/Rec2 family competence protein [Gemmataceae bacterium]